MACVIIYGTITIYIERFTIILFNYGEIQTSRFMNINANANMWEIGNVRMNRDFNLFFDFFL